MGAMGFLPPQDISSHLIIYQPIACNLLCCKYNNEIMITNNGFITSLFTQTTFRSMNATHHPATTASGLGQRIVSE